MGSRQRKDDVQVHVPYFYGTVEVGKQMTVINKEKICKAEKYCSNKMSNSNMYFTNNIYIFVIL